MLFQPSSPIPPTPFPATRGASDGFCTLFDDRGNLAPAEERPVKTTPAPNKVFSPAVSSFPRRGKGELLQTVLDAPEVAEGPLNVAIIRGRAQETGYPFEEYLAENPCSPVGRQNGDSSQRRETHPHTHKVFQGWVRRIWAFADNPHPGASSAYQDVRNIAVVLEMTVCGTWWTPGSVLSPLPQQGTAGKSPVDREQNF